jgi:hypothetical protein
MLQPFQWLGRGAGVLTAPITGGIAFLRRARTFHPRGLIHRVDVRVHPMIASEPSELREASVRLAGQGIIRLSSAWWKKGERPDLLGAAIRIDDQDLLFATARSLVTLLPATLSTDVHDFLANDYFAMAPFELEGVGRVRLKLKSLGRSPEGTSREQRLLAALEQGRPGFDLLVSRGGEYEPFAHVWIGDPVEVDDERLQFSPMHDGRGVKPVGFVNNARRMTYLASRRARKIAAGRSSH